MPGSKNNIWSSLKSTEIGVSERYALERERRRAEERLKIATKHTRTALLKENTREFRNNQQNTQNRKNMEYGKVVSDVPIRKDLK